MGEAAVWSAHQACSLGRLGWGRAVRAQRGPAQAAGPEGGWGRHDHWTAPAPHHTHPRRCGPPRIPPSLIHGERDHSENSQEEKSLETAQTF